MSDENKLDLSLFRRFEGLEDQDFKLTKTGSKRRSMVGVGQYETGSFRIFDYDQYKDEHPELEGKYGAFIQGRGFGDFLRTSPILKINEYDDRSVSFETEGGYYKLAMHPSPRPAPKECHKCGTVNDYKDMIMKMGGLLCTNCNVILCEPYSDEEYFNERARRYKEPAEDEDEGGSEGI